MSSNSSILVISGYSQPLGIGALPGITPCAPQSGGIYDIPAYLVQENDLVNVTFAGTPPYNLSATLYDPSYPNKNYCNSLPYTVLDKNWFLWTVGENISATTAYSWGDTVTFTAVQLTGQNGSYYPYYASGNMTLTQNETKLVNPGNGTVNTTIPSTHTSNGNSLSCGKLAVGFLVLSMLVGSLL